MNSWPARIVWLAVICLIVVLPYAIALTPITLYCAAILLAILHVLAFSVIQFNRRYLLLIFFWLMTIINLGLLTQFKQISPLYFLFINMQW